MSERKSKLVEPASTRACDPADAQSLSPVEGEAQATGSPRRSRRGPGRRSVAARTMTGVEFKHLLDTARCTAKAFAAFVEKAPHTVQGWITDDKVPTYAQRLVRGESLDQWLEESGMRRKRKHTFNYPPDTDAP